MTMGILRGLFACLAIALPVGAETFFTNPPRFLSAETTFEATGFPNPTYLYYVQIPDGIGRGIKTIEIVQEEGSEAISYNPARIAIKEANNIAFTVKLEPKKLAINFAQPLQQSQTITIAISPYHNPLLDGIYQFRVSALPEGESPREQFLGYARFNFDRPDN